MLADDVVADDAQLLREYARTRSPHAFAQITDRYLGMVYSTAIRRVRDAHLAEDVTQAVFLMLSQRAFRLSDRTILAGWLYRAARYAASNAMRIERRRRAHQQAAAQVQRTESRMNPQWQQIEPVLDAAMDSLRAGDRDVILLRFFQGQSIPEICKTLGTSENTASKRLSRALERLRDALGRQGITTGDAALGAVLSSEAIRQAPPALRAALSGMGRSSSAAAIAKGATTMMSLTVPVKIAAAVAVTVLIPAAIVVTAVQMPPHPTTPPPLAAATTAPAAASAPQAPAAAINHVVPSDNVLPEIRFERVSLTDALDFYRDVSRANIFVDWNSLARAGVESNKPISVARQNIKLSELIDLTLQLAARTPGTLDYTVDSEGVIRITSTLEMPWMLGRAAMVQSLKADSPAAARKLPEARFASTKLADTIDFMRDVSGASIFVKWNDLENAHISRDRLMSSNIRDASAAEILDLILVSASSKDTELIATVDKASNVIDVGVASRAPAGAK